MESHEELLPPAYSAKEVEAKWYSFWESKGFFTPRQSPKVKPYTIVIPPPNVTGILHMGHALNNTIQDILIRWQRMRGVPTLWVPGTDHAGIATQNVVEKKLAGEGKSRFDLGREKFVEEVWKWKEQYGSTIVRQLRRLGASCDWTRERFTMDEGLSRAVRYAFVKLYEEGLIYQGFYIINWCPRCQTALSDEEAPYREVEGKLYYYHYLIRDPASGHLAPDRLVVIATTRPETMLGDTALAVNPKDKRYRGLARKQIYLPLQNRPLRLIADDLVDPAFGTGIVKVTPAHDPNDFEMGRRHRLEFRNILHPDGRVNEKGTPYEGMDRFQARKKILEDLEKEGLLVREEVIRHKVPHCYRCHTIVEPYLSKQWFVKMKPLAAKALRAQRNKKVLFFPRRWTKVYIHWLANIRDWCISRQIWWGHQIPVWYCDPCLARSRAEGATVEMGLGTGRARTKKGGKNAGVIVTLQDPKRCPVCGNRTLTRDPDVLDTWFSSWLWPFSTLGWPDRTKDLAYFYPTSSLATAPEIIFFWVARMIMAGLHFMKGVPYGHVYIHGTVRTDTGQKMSKSLGNAIDPLELIEEIGADALRFSIIMLTASGQDAFLSREKFELGRNFTNKIWNAARFTLANLKGFQMSALDALPDFAHLSVVNQWMLSSLQRVIQSVDRALTTYRFNDAATALYHFFWHEFCDWYLELSKPVFQSEDAREKEATSAVLLTVFETTLRLMHPWMPFLTEEIWQRLRKHYGEDSDWPESIMIHKWPKTDRRRMAPRAERKIRRMQEAVVGIRDLRAKLRVAPNQTVPVVLKTKGDGVKNDLELFASTIGHLAKADKLEVVTRFERQPSFVSNIFREMEIFLRVEGVVDVGREKERIQKRIEETLRHLEQVRCRLESEDFIRRAPEEVVEREKNKGKELKAILSDLEENLALFSRVS